MGNARDKCFTYSGYLIKFLETGEVKPLAVKNLKGNDNIIDNDFGCKKVSWYKDHSCNLHLTQCQQTVGCCKSYGTVLKEFLDAWAKRYRSRYGEYGRHLEETASEPRGQYPSKPTECPSTYEARSGFYEKIVISNADGWFGGKADDLNGGLYVHSLDQTFTTNDISNILDQPNRETTLGNFLDFWFGKCRAISAGNNFIDIFGVTALLVLGHSDNATTVWYYR